MRTVVTDRLILVPATENILQAEIEDRDRLGFLLGAQIPYNWPPDEYLDAIPVFLSALQSNPALLGWQSWYWLRRESAPERPTVIGSGGFRGEPDSTGTIELGYSVLPQYERLGYATEGSRGLIDWAMGQREVNRIIAETLLDNEASIRVLEKLGFAPAPDEPREGMKRFELLRK
jgi:[ribosomal protein S5]-alanine N-acetyltransferase